MAKRITEIKKVSPIKIIKTSIPKIKTTTTQTMNNTTSVDGYDLLKILEENGIIFDIDGKVVIKETGSYNHNMAIQKTKKYTISCVKTTTKETEEEMVLNKVEKQHIDDENLALDII